MRIHRAFGISRSARRVAQGGGTAFVEFRPSKFGALRCNQVFVADQVGNSRILGHVGRVAQAAGVKRLIVSHIGPFNVDAAVAELKQAYTGPLTVGADLQCTPVQ